MLKKILVVQFLFYSFIPYQLTASADKSELKAAFIRDDDLWMKIDRTEKQLTDKEYVRYPKWSHDGNWIAYIEAAKKEGYTFYTGDLWIYNTNNNKHYKVMTDVNNNFQWSPWKNDFVFLPSNFFPYFY